MSKTAAYLADTADYMNEQARSVIEELNDAQFDSLVEALDFHNEGEEPGVDCDLVRTSETFADFDDSSRQWAECGAEETGVFGGFAAIKYDNVQIRKGQQRHTITVLDLGDYRIVLK